MAGPGGVLVGRGYVVIRPEFQGDWDRRVGAQTQRSGDQGGRTFGRAFARGAGAAMSGLGKVVAASVAGAGLSAATVGITQLGTAALAASAVAVPALSAIGTAGAAVGVGLKGVGDAFKAFDSAAQDAKAAAAATRQVESAQRALSRAQQGVAEARVAAARRVQDAERGLRDAQRDAAEAQMDVVDAQRDALEVQRELTGARQEAARQLEDLNTRVREGALDQREAALRVTEAEKALAEARKEGDADQVKRAELALERAKLGVEQQSRDYKRLQEDAAKANKAGVEGSEQVVAVRERIADANDRVKDAAESAAEADRKVADARREVSEAQADGARQVADAQEAVADAARALADAQQAAASQVSKVDEAMAKLTPSAREFVETVKDLGPAWGEVRKATQESLFKGLGTSFREMSEQIIPDVKSGLSGAADQINLMVRNWMSGVRQMSQDGTLKRFFDGNNEILGNFAKWPEEATRGWVQLSIAAQPALDKLTLTVADASTRLSERMTEAFESGRMERAISGAFEELKVLKDPLADIGTIFKNLFDSMVGPGGEVLGFIAEFLDGLARITSMPAVKQALEDIFGAFADITKTVFDALTPLVEHGLPLLARGLEWVADALPVVVDWLGRFASVVVDWIGAGIGAAVRGTQDFFGAFQAGTTADIAGQASALERFGAATRGFTSGAADQVRTMVDAFKSGDLAPQWFESSTSLAGVFDRLGVASREVYDAVGPLVSALVDLGRGVGESLLPPLESVGRLLAQTWQHQFERIASIARDFLAPAFAAVGDFLRDRLVPALDSLGGKLSGLVEAARPIMGFLDSLLTWLVKLSSNILGWLVPALLQLAGPVFTFLINAIGLAVDAVTGILRSITWLGESAVWLWNNAIGPAFRGIAAAATWLWREILAPAFEGIGIAARILAAVIGVLLVAPVLIAFELLATAGTFLWQTSLKPAFEGIGAAATWLWANAIGPAFGAIGAAADWLWRVMIQPVTNFVVAAFHGTGDTATWLWNQAIQPAFTAIGNAASWLWTNGIKPPFESAIGMFKELSKWAEDTWSKVTDWFGKIGTKVTEVLNSFKPLFEGAKTGVDEVWKGVAEVAAAPVRFIVDKVYSAGIRKVWNFIVEKIGLGNLALPEAKLEFAGGGIVPGYAPGQDRVKAMLSPGEGVLVPEAVRALGPSWVYSTNAYYSKGRAPGGTGHRYAGGGVVGMSGPGLPMGGVWDPRDWDDMAGDAIDWAKQGLGAAYQGLKEVPLIGDAIKWAEKVVRGAAAEAAEKMLRPIAGWAGDGIAGAVVGATRLSGGNVSKDSAWVNLLRGAPTALIDKLVAKIRADDAEQQSFGGVWLKPADGAYGATFNQAGPMWASGRHTGLDILASAGSDVRAVAAGQVASALSGGPYGNHIILNHAGGIQSLYAHLASMLVAFGDAVSAGQKIGTVGSTGNSTGPHLHLEARSLSRGSFDPMEMLNAPVGRAPTGQVAAWIAQAMQITGLGSDARWAKGLFTIAMRESGGDPRSINLWDSNARQGYDMASKGLMQTIGPTFRSYALPGFQDIWNPVHNAIAAIRYIQAVYGDISKVQQADPNKKPKGYSLGGIVPERGTHDVGGLLKHGQVGLNMSGRPEAVLTDSQWSAMYAIASNRANAGVGSVHVYVGDREITDIVRTEVRDVTGAVVGALDGRG